MSYKRAHCIQTLKHLEYCTYVVREEEEEAYREAGVEDILVIPKGATLKDGTRIYNFMTTLWWIIENAPEDVLFIADDDISDFMYQGVDTILHSDLQNGKELSTSEIERIAQLIVDLDIGIACDNPFYAPYGYTQEFVFKCVPGAARWINKKCLKAKFDPKDWATGDVDLIMQELLHNRIILNPRYFKSFSPTLSNEGGSRVTSKQNKNYILAMKNKWGKYIDFNFAKNLFSLNVKR